MKNKGQYFLIVKKMKTLHLLHDSERDMKMIPQEKSYFIHKFDSNIVDVR